ncbi:hypothetical protein L6452_15333 [Arctium lappa]|uniref:Uncharacterized protein n=1 Tax=Arctium lappa TaxID=4217 RepID=A0ACB9CNN0_ARCLA|nr:hypothetical protein L6452_15333 [Arctium lappa]
MMAGLQFFDEHNEVAMLQKPKQAEGFHQIVDFIKSTHIAHALTVNPTIYVEHQRQLWANVAIQTEDGTQVYVPKPPKGKVFSNMKRPSKDFSGIDTPLFSTMMGVSPSHGEASGSQPTSDHPTDDLPTPLVSSNPPQIPIVKPTSPITKTYIRKKVISQDHKICRERN